MHSGNNLQCPRPRPPIDPVDPGVRSHLRSPVVVPAGLFHRYAPAVVGWAFLAVLGVGGVLAGAIAAVAGFVAM